MKTLQVTYNQAITLLENPFISVKIYYKQDCQMCIFKTTSVKRLRDFVVNHGPYISSFELFNFKTRETINVIMATVVETFYQTSINFCYECD